MNLALGWFDWTDHIAFIIREENGELVLLEASQKEGVGLLRWSTFRKNNWQQLYRNIMFRHLEMSRTSERQKCLDIFVKGVIGKKYRMMRKKKEVSEELKTAYFSAELTASALKALGALSKEVSSANYKISSFTSKRTLPMLLGAKYQGEELIDFNLK